MNLKENNFLAFFLIIIFSVFLSFSHSLYQVSIDSGLVLSEIIKYPEPISPMKYYYFNSWTLLNQFSEILLISGFSIDISSNIILFLSSLCFTLSAFIIIKKYTENFYLALIASLLLLILEKNFGDTDYPSLLISNNTYGMMGLAVSSLIFALLINNNYKLSGFFSAFLICIHPVLGIWVTSILIVSSIFFKDRNVIKELSKGAILGLILTLISLVFYFKNKIGITDFNLENLDIYMEYWDGHRNTYGKIHYEYLIKTLILLFLINFYYLQNNKKDLFKIFFNFSVILSLIFYIFYKLMPHFFPEIFVRVIPSRFLILHSFVAWPLIISLVYMIFSRFNLTKKYIEIFIIIILFVYSIQHYKNFIKIKDRFFENIFTESKYTDTNIFNEISNLNLPGYFITTSTTVGYTSRIGLKPILLDTTSFDFIPYQPYLVNNVFEIMKDVYNVDLKNPPIRNNTYLPDNFIKSSFEKKDVKDWKLLNKKYNATYIVVPSEWNIELNLFKKNKSFSIYKIQ